MGKTRSGFQGIEPQHFEQKHHQENL